MTALQGLTLVACALELALGLVCILKARTSSLAPRLGVLCLICFTWNFAACASSITGVREWSYLDMTVSPWTTGALLDLVLHFVGERRRQRWWMRGFYGVSGLLSAATASAFFTDFGRGFAGSEAWDLAHLGLMIVGLPWTAALLIRHARQDQSEEELLRTRLVLAVVAIGAVMGPLELATGGMEFPLTIVTSSLLTFVVFRFRFLESELATLSLVYAGAASIVAVGSSIAIVRGLEPTLGIAILAVAIIAMALLAVLRPVLAGVLRHRDRVARLATLGRLSAQMEHDLRNPLAALKGAAQFLQEERARDRSIDGQQAFLTLLVNETDRLSRLIDKYRRLGRLEPSTSTASLNVLVTRALSLHALQGRGVQVESLLHEGVPWLELDEDLVLTALENVLINAIEATAPGGVVRVSTRLERHGRTLTLEVEDHGSGMSARTRERAFDEFFTTKARGSGLGLPLVRQIVEAHGGRVTLTSQVGKGTRLCLHFPVHRLHPDASGPPVVDSKAWPADAAASFPGGESAHRMNQTRGA